MGPDETCIFCNSEDIRSRTIVRGRYAFAFPTNIPVVPGHLLICPTRHVALPSELKRHELLAVFRLAERLKPALAESFGAEGFNLAWNEGTTAGQNVGHFHLHLLPRRKGDAGVVGYEPRKFLYRPGSRETSPASELRSVSSRIKASLQKLGKKK